MTLKGGDESRHGLKENHDGFYLNKDKSKPSTAALMAKHAADDFMPNSNDSERNRFYNHYMKESRTVKKLQTIKKVAIVNELKYKERNLFHNLKQN